MGKVLVRNAKDCFLPPATSLLKPLLELRHNQALTVFWSVTLKPIIFVHDGMNSVADYNSLRVGVGCRMYGWILDVPRQISRWDNF